MNTKSNTKTIYLCRFESILLFFVFLGEAQGNVDKCQKLEPFLEFNGWNAPGLLG